MAATHEKAPHGCSRNGAKAGSDRPVEQPFTHSSRAPSLSQAPGSALAAFLKRYRRDLLSLTPDKHISQLVDCVDYLLAEVDRQGVTHG